MCTCTQCMLHSASSEEEKPGTNPGEKTSLTAGTNSANVDAFHDCGGTTNCDVAIDVRNNNWERPNKSRLKFVRPWLNDPNAITHAIVVSATTEVFAHEIAINEELAFVLESMQIGDERNVQDHVATKGESAR